MTTFNISRFKNVEKKTYECEVITPMFLAGADQNTAELRTQSIKGALRFWWRAICFRGAGVEQMKQEEALLFGDAGNVGKSITTVRLLSSTKLTTTHYSPVPHKNASFTFVGVKPGQFFTLEIIGHEKTHKIFEIFSILGGVGRRSRRGFGAFRIKTVNEQKYDQPSQLLDSLYYRMHSLSAHFQKSNGIIELNEPPLVEFPYVERVQVAGKFDDYDHALRHIGQCSHDHNSMYTGFAKGKNRQASPVYVTIFADESGYRPIVITLHPVFAPRINMGGRDTSQSFIDAVLQGGTQ